MQTAMSQTEKVKSNVVRQNKIYMKTAVLDRKYKERTSQERERKKSARKEWKEEMKK